MAVGITIVSGTRQGEQLAFDQPEFRAGGDAACEIFFDPRQEPAVSGRQALFRLGDDGWYVKATGGGSLLVNHRQVEASTRLRSGDVIRLAPEGPELTYQLLARLPAGVPKAASGLATAAAEPQPSAVAHPPTEVAAGQSPVIYDWRFAASLVAGTLVGLAVLYLVVRQPGLSEVPGPPSSGPAPGAARETTAAAPLAVNENNAPQESSRPDANNHVAEESGDGVLAAPPAAAQTPKDPPADAVLLLLVEEPKSASAWPFGSASAIADHTLLTSATVATGLAGFRDKGWRLWATNQSLGLKLAVTELRVHAGFVRASGDPEKQIYVDLGLLTVADSLPKQLALAGADELADLDRGMPVTLVGYLPENEPVDRFRTFLPEPHAGKIFVMTSLPPSPGGPRLMHVRAELSGKMYGAPLLNSSGRVVGVFAETAVPTPEQQGADLQIHYAPVADAAQIDRGIKNHDDQWWAPAVASQPAK